MIYKKLRKLKKYKQDLSSCMLAAYQSGADPEVIAIRVSDLESELVRVDQEIEFEKLMTQYKLANAIFLVFAASLIVIAFIKKYLL